MPPKKRFERPMTVVFTQAQIEYIEKWADDHGQYKSDVVRLALDEYIQRMEEANERQGN